MGILYLNLRENFSEAHSCEMLEEFKNILKEIVTFLYHLK